MAAFGRWSLARLSHMPHGVLAPFSMASLSTAQKTRKFLRSKRLGPSPTLSRTAPAASDGGAQAETVFLLRDIREELRVVAAKLTLMASQQASAAPAAPYAPLSFRSFPSAPPPQTLSMKDRFEAKKNSKPSKKSYKKEDEDESDDDSDEEAPRPSPSRAKGQGQSDTMGKGSSIGRGRKFPANEQSQSHSPDVMRGKSRSKGKEGPGREAPHGPSSRGRQVDQDKNLLPGPPRDWANKLMGTQKEKSRGAKAAFAQQFQDSPSAPASSQPASETGLNQAALATPSSATSAPSTPTENASKSGRTLLISSEKTDVTLSTSELREMVQIFGTVQKVSGSGRHAMVVMGSEEEASAAEKALSAALIGGAPVKVIRRGGGPVPSG